MTAEIKDEAPVTGADFRWKKRFTFSLKNFFRWDKKPSGSFATTPVPGPPNEPIRPPTPPPDGKSQWITAKSNLAKTSEPAAEGGSLAHAQGKADDRASWATGSEVSSQHQDHGHQEDTSHAENPQSLGAKPPPDLWAKAWVGLSEETKLCLKSPWDMSHDKRSHESAKSKSDKRSKGRDDLEEDEQAGEPITNAPAYVEEVIYLTTEKLHDYQNRWGTDDKHTALGKATKILESALTVKELVDATLKFDPSGYASCAWAVVSFGLTVGDG